MLKSLSAVAIFNLYDGTPYLVNENDCFTAMEKQSNTDSLCYGKTHKDTEGGYWKVDGIGYFGAEVSRT